jgi:hypothetical protein
VQGSKPPLSRRHWKLEADSLAVNVNVALVLDVLAGGPEPMVVWGAVASTAQLRLAGEPSTLPAASRARTRNWWLPPARPLYAFGEVQRAKAALSSEHSKVAPDSFDEKVRVAPGPVVDGGPEPMVV